MSDNVTTYQVNDEITIKRGKQGGKSAKVLAVTGTGEGAEYAVQTTDGVLTVVTHANIKAPAELFVAQSRLVSAFNKVLSGYDGDRWALSELALTVDAAIGTTLMDRIDWRDGKAENEA